MLIHSQRSRWDRALGVPQATSAPRAELHPSHAPVSSQCSLLHHLLKWGPKPPICCQDFGFLSQQHLLIMEPVPCPRFPSAQWARPQVDLLLRTRLKLLLCLLCKLTLQLLPGWNIPVPKHPSSLCREWRCVSWAGLWVLQLALMWQSVFKPKAGEVSWKVPAGCCSCWNRWKICLFRNLLVKIVFWKEVGVRHCSEDSLPQWETAQQKKQLSSSENSAWRDRRQYNQWQ